MFLKKIIYVNWGNIPNMEFEFGPVNLFSGGNGSGKTTAADGIQALMTATTNNLFNFNPGQDETTQRGRGGKQMRTLASYILGCDDGSYARLRTTDGYIAGVFHPTKGENGEAFTAIMGVRASLDTAGSQRQARQDKLLLLITPGLELQLKHFVRGEKTTKYVVTLDEITNLLQREFGKAAIELYDDKKKTYLRRLYSALKGKKSAVSDHESTHAAKTFANFMAYKPVKSINEFVAKEILEAKDLSEDIKQVSDLMKTIHNMEKETAQVKLALDNLQQSQEYATHYIDHWIGYTVGQHTEITRQIVVTQEQYLSLKTKLNDKSNERKENDNRIAINKTKKQKLHNDLIRLEAERQGIPALKSKDELEEQIEKYQENLVQNAKPLLEQLQSLDTNVQHAKNIETLLSQNVIGVDIPEFDQKTFKNKLKQMPEKGKNTLIDSQKLFNTDWVGITDLESKLDELMGLEKFHNEFYQLFYTANSLIANDRNLRDKVITLENKLKGSQSKNQRLITEKEQQIYQLESKSVSYPSHVEAAIKAINQQCPQARPTVLCDYIEIIEPEWQMAIEGFIGGNRFSIIVEPEFEAKAISIVRNIKGKRNNAKIIQGSRAQREAEKLSLAKNSIFDAMEFEHRIVEYYIKAAYGNVIMVPDTEALKSTPRGITTEGLAANSYTMFRCDLDDGDLVFGQSARERALQAKQKELIDLRSKQDEIDKKYRAIAELSDLVSSINPIQCSERIKTMLELYRDLQYAEQQLNKLDLGEFKEIEESLKAAKEDYDTASEIISKLETLKGELNKEIENVGNEISKLSNVQEKLQILQETSEKEVLAIPTIYPNFNADESLQHSEQRAKQAGRDVCFSDDNQMHSKQMDDSERELDKVIAAHNQESNTYANIHYFVDTGKRHDKQFFKGIVSIKHDVDLVYNNLKNNVLIDKHENLQSLKDSFNTAFVTNLCHSIYQAINDGKRILDDLNKELKHHRFGTDREVFYFSMSWIPEFHEYYKFFKEIINNPNLGDGSTLFDVELSEKSIGIRDKLLNTLLDKEEQFAFRDLKRISDYRNYREYEIYKEPEGKDPIPLSKYGTGSGGQLETPAYIIRSAAITSAFKFNEGNTHCRMVLVDEAFSKMDEARSREVINYLTETQGLQLIFIMPTSKSGSFLDLISHQTIFSKCGTAEKIGELNSVVNVNRSECNQEKIKELWANHKTTLRHQASLDFMDEFIQE